MIIPRSLVSVHEHGVINGNCGHWRVWCGVVKHLGP